MDGARSASTWQGSLRKQVRLGKKERAVELRSRARQVGGLHYLAICSAFAAVEDTGHFIIRVSYFAAFNQPLTSFIN